jgi:hypothetical protein
MPLTKTSVDHDLARLAKKRIYIDEGDAYALIPDDKHRNECGSNQDN